MRAFIAIELEPEIKANLAELVRRLKAKGAPGVSWARESSFHLTIKFLGEIDEAEAADVAAALTRIASETPPFPLTVAGTGAFPGGSRPPRVLWAGIAEEPGLTALQARLEADLGRLGFPSEDRPFHPHLTLGRVREPRGLAGVMAEIERRRQDAFGAMTVRRLTFFRSVLKPEGAEHTPIAEIELG